MEHEIEQRRRIKELEVMVADTISEAPDTSTLVFFTGNDRLDYKPGHFLTIDPHQFESLTRFTAFLEDLKGKKEPPRAYSISSSPHEKYLAITVKEERYTSGITKYPPLMSPMLVKRTTKGMRLTVTGFTGPYTLDDDIESQTDHILHVCAGSGSVPNFSMLKFSLVHHPKVRHTLVYSNKTWSDIIFRAEIESLARRYPDRFTVIHTLTREQDNFSYSPTILKGRLTADMIRAAVPDPRAVRAFVCGPAISVYDRLAAKEKGTPPAPKFLETALECLKEVGIPADRVTKESYG